MEMEVTALGNSERRAEAQLYVLSRTDGRRRFIYDRPTNSLELQDGITYYCRSARTSDCLQLHSTRLDIVHCSCIHMDLEEETE